jgi:NADH-quinone oxidoreductase subunit B
VDGRDRLDQRPGPARYRVAGRGLTLSVFDLGLACCAVEFAAAVAGHPDLLPLAGEQVDDEPGLEVMVVSGTVTDKLTPAVLRHYEQMPEPRHVISFGSCANSGGPYWDSYCVTKGVDQVLPVDVYVPGCPPRPEALLQGLEVLQERLARELG